LNTKKIFQNILSQSIGRALSFILIFLSITIAARKLGVEQFGIFASVLALVTIISKIIDLGFGQIVFREFSKNNDVELINNALLLRILFSIIVFAVSNFVIYFLGYSSFDILLFDILFINIYISARFLNIRDLLETPFKVELKMHFVMATLIIDNLILLILVILLPNNNNFILYFTIAYVFSNIPGFLILIFLLKRYFYFRFKIIYQKSEWLLKESLPLFGYVLMLAVFQQLDVLLLKEIDSSYSAGIYSAASRLTLPLSIIPIAIISTVYPIIVKNYNKNNYSEELRRLIQKILFVISYSAFVVFLFKSEEFVIIIFGNEFRGASLPAIILFGGFVFLFYNFFALDLLTVFNRQKINFIYSIFIVTIDLTLIWILIDDYSYMGVALAKSISILLGSIMLLGFYTKYKVRIKYFNWSLMLWALILLILIFAVSNFPIGIYIILSTVILAGVTFILKIFKSEELLIIKKIAKSDIDK